MVELMVTLTILGILACVIANALRSAKVRSKRAVCVQQIRQITLGTLVYADETGAFFSKDTGVRFDFIMFLNPERAADNQPRRATVYACPLDVFNRDDGGATPRARWSSYPFTSYHFNGHNADSPEVPGIAGFKPESIQNPARTVVILEHPSTYGASWHDKRGPATRQEALNGLGYADGHVAEVPIYWDGKRFPFQYDPGQAYAYQWSAR
jgi:type II secretory pathway pseudopilin PulG